MIIEGTGNPKFCIALLKLFRDLKTIPTKELQFKAVEQLGSIPTDTTPATKYRWYG
jgi:hypothetical protein